jgi:hypothetical protein
MVEMISDILSNIRCWCKENLVTTAFAEMVVVANLLTAE